MVTAHCSPRSRPSLQAARPVCLFLPHLQHVHWISVLTRIHLEKIQLMEGTSWKDWTQQDSHSRSSARCQSPQIPSPAPSLGGRRTTDPMARHPPSSSSPCATRGTHHPPRLPPSPSTRAGCLQSTTLPSASLVLPRPFHCPFCHRAAMQQWSRPETATP